MLGPMVTTWRLLQCSGIPWKSSNNDKVRFACRVENLNLIDSIPFVDQSSSVDYMIEILSGHLPLTPLQQFLACTRISFLGTDEEEEVRRLYGSGFAMKLATERRLANQFGMNSIGGGIPSSTNLMSDILTGRDQIIGFEDTLGLPEYRPLFNKAKEDPHMSMERTLRM
jgi:hypothetical protein